MKLSINETSMTDQLLSNETVLLHNKVLIFAGPTGVGKTSAAIRIAKQVVAENKFPAVDIICADSRQVYVGLPILTGADTPKDSVRSNDSDLPYSFWQTAWGAMHGIGICEWDEDWSLKQFQEFAQKTVAWSLSRGRLPIIVGGTGLFCRWWNTPLPAVEPNDELRATLDKMSLEELQAEVIKLDSTALDSLNQSDRSNPRRLVRVIEKLQSGVVETEVTPLLPVEQLFFVFSAPSATLQDAIEKRVRERWKAGALHEVEILAAWVAQKSGRETLPITTATGVAELYALVKGFDFWAEAIKKWSQREHQYAKRQQTWFKKEENAVWVDVLDPDWYAKVYETIFK